MLEVHARRMIALEAELERAMGEVGERIAGRLQLGSSTGPGEVLLPRAARDVPAGPPGRDGRASSCRTRRSICDRVLDGELELGIVGAARPHRGLEFAPFLRDELVVIAPPDHPLASRSSIGLEELARLPLLMQQTRFGGARGARGRLARRGIRPQDLRRRDGARLAAIGQGGVLDGLGLTVISRLTVDAEVADGRLVAIPIEGHELVARLLGRPCGGRTPTRLTAAFLSSPGRELADNP